MLSKIKDIAQKAKVVGDHVRKFFRSIMDSVSHVGERGSPRVSPSPAPPHPAFSLSLSPLPAACPSTLAPGPQPEPCTMSGCGWRTWAECATTSWARRTAAACASSMRPRTGVSVPSPSSSSSATSSFFSGPFVVWPMVSGSLSLCRRGGKWRGGPIPTTGASPWQRPLLSAVALLFCIIPQYIQSFLKRKIGDREYPSAVTGLRVPLCPASALSWLLPQPPAPRGPLSPPQPSGMLWTASTGSSSSTSRLCTALTSASMPARAWGRWPWTSWRACACAWSPSARSWGSSCTSPSAPFSTCTSSEWAGVLLRPHDGDSNPVCRCLASFLCPQGAAVPSPIPPG